LPPRLLYILAADNEAAILRLLERALPPYGFVVTAASGGREALSLYAAAAGGIDLVLLDARMPDLGGPHALAALRAIDPAARVCFMTTGVAEFCRAELLPLGAAWVFGKPFRSLDGLARRLRAIAERP
jgi:CheY-like chemotaxis protein